jgi:transcription-repair coupling factor (superfamily II helicase)
MLIKSANPLQPQITLKPGQKQYWGQLPSTSMSLLLAQLLTKHYVVVITSDSLNAQLIKEDIKFFANEAVIHEFPDWETLPYDMFSPHQDIISERLTTLYELSQLQTGLLILPVTTLMHRLPPLDYVHKNVLILRVKQTLDLIKFRNKLVNSGYVAANTVTERGQFALRGSLLDLFPMGSKLPYRIDFFDNEIEQIRSFDPETQLSLNKVQQIRLLPAREFILDKQTIELFSSQWRANFAGDVMRCPLYQDINDGLAAAGAEYYLPLFFNELANLFDYLPDNSLIVTIEAVEQAAQHFAQEIKQRYELLRHDIQRPLLPPEQIFLTVEQLLGQFKHYPQLNLTQNNCEHKHAINWAVQNLPALEINNRSIAELRNFLQNCNSRVLITVESSGRHELMLELLAKHELLPTTVTGWADFMSNSAPLCITQAPLQQGFCLIEPNNLIIITETNLFGERVTRQYTDKQQAKPNFEQVIRNLIELNIGDPVVHEEYGVGRYQGLITLNIDNIMAEFLQLEYANNDKLYVPVANLHLITRFTGLDPEHAPLHRLGSKQWEKAKTKATKIIADVAVELLDIYAQREAKIGHSFQYDKHEYAQFVASFPFSETKDQQQAITEVLADMHAPRPMDRLICGDVGFGKTEIAMRAAFVAVNDGKQVAVLVPTTLLAQQHYQTFLDRFSAWPVKITQLSRFISQKQQNQDLDQIAQGHIDIVIGTHKLLQDKVKFKQLGLLIIDEEHRFGVKQKELFKKLRAEVDILTLTATPIPRSLNLAITSLRDLSIIATPPARRLAIKTFVTQWQDAIIIEAITRELSRGGQVYFLHNQIESMENMMRKISNLVPIARINYAHGQMPERQLEQVMQDFYHRRFNVLLCTTIIETGIDIPSANTMIINRADKFGLAQLYQLRGRVGRSHHRAYAYLLVPSKQLMTPDAIKRLDAISSHEELGVGFSLATHDLEIRGAGALLGDKQSGHIQEVGYSLYSALLERAVNALQNNQNIELTQPLPVGCEINLYLPALLPDDYLPDVYTRLLIYKRLANADNAAKLDQIQVEMIDRFGLLPEYAKNLIKLTKLKLLANSLGITKIEVNTNNGYLVFNSQPNINLDKLLTLIKTNPQHYRFDGQHKLRLNMSLPEAEQRLELITQLLHDLQPG